MKPESVTSFKKLSVNSIFFEGGVEGTITESGKGKDGFSYDSVFLPDGFDETFTEMFCQTKKSNQSTW